MNQNTLKNIIISLLVVIIILLILLYLYHSRASPIPSANTTSNTSIPTIVKSVPPVILDSPYLYDSGYWVSPDAWWMSPDAGDTYVHNNYKTHYNYYYDKATNSTKPIPTTTAASAITTAASAITTAPTVSPSMLPPQPNPTPSATISGIQEILPTGPLIAPSQNSVFPLPTLAPTGMVMPPNTMMMNNAQMPELPIQNTIPTMMADSMAAKVDTQASQLLGMRGGNTIQESSMPEVAL